MVSFALRGRQPSEAGVNLSSPGTAYHLAGRDPGRDHLCSGLCMVYTNGVMYAAQLGKPASLILSSLKFLPLLY